MRRTILAALAVLALAGAASADEVLLNDGTRLVGQVDVIYNGKATVHTDFAGQVQIDAAKIRGVWTKGPVAVQLKNGERAVGTMSVGPDGGQMIVEAEGTRKIALGDVAALWPSTQESPDVLEMKAKLNAKLWKFKLELGAIGQSGNSDTIAINGAVSAKYQTDVDRLLFYAQGRYSHENGKDTSRDVLGGVDFEHNFTPRLFVFGHGELENDEFQDLDLRVTVAAGLGYDVIKSENLSWKIRGGPGYEHDSYGDGSSRSTAIAEAGEFLDWKVAPWITFHHAFEVYPSLQDTKDYRATLDNNVVIPLDKEANWSLKLGVRNQYVSDPQPGTKRLDTWYFLNLAYDF